MIGPKPKRKKKEEEQQKNRRKTRTILMGTVSVSGVVNEKKRSLVEQTGGHTPSQKRKMNRSILSCVRTCPWAFGGFLGVLVGLR